MADTVRITAAEAIVRFLIAQRIVVDGENKPLFPGVIAIFGHGNVTSLGHSLESHRTEIPVWRGQNEQGMGLAAAAFSKAMRRQQIMVCTSSIGPGATNMVTAAGVAMANRLPVLFIAGDTFASRLPDPVIQQVEHFGVPSTTVNDSFKPVVRFWDRVNNPAQLLSSLPQALATMLDPADCGPAFIGLPQDVAAEAYDFPTKFFETKIHEIARPRPDRNQVSRAVEVLRSAKRPVIIAGGGVHYSRAEQELADFALRFGIPVVETVAGKSSLLATHPRYSGPLGVTGTAEANELVSAADVVLAIGTRLEDFTTGSWTLFESNAQVIGINAARFDAAKHRSLAVVGDALESLNDLTHALADWVADKAWTDRASALKLELIKYVDGRTSDDGIWPPSYAQLVGLVNKAAEPEDYVLTAAGGLPGELNINWMSKGIATFDCEYGFSCMGYEIAGGWGAAMARPTGQVFTMVGDGSYLMLNSELYSSVLSGHKIILVVCDNEGFAVIERLQLNKGGASYNNMLADSLGTGSKARVDFRAHASALGATAFEVNSLTEFSSALEKARECAESVVIVCKVRPDDFSETGSFWQVGVPEVSAREQVEQARKEVDEGLKLQRKGI
ncbi:MAG: 3,5/4-trihydroxycyclohexa,2-dione hydrolase [Actinomycetota bacterium]